MNIRTGILTLLLIHLLWGAVNAQTEKGIRGVVVKKGTKVRVANARIFNRRTNYTATSDKFGFFSILAASKDSLFVDADGYNPAKICLDTLKDVVTGLTMNNMLAEVVIKGKSRKEDLQEALDNFHSKGIYYKGKPPIALLSPLGGSPVTFFNELLSKDAKRARKLDKYAKVENEYYEIALKFNNTIIKKTVPILDAELADFKSAYWPSIDHIREWNEFDLRDYIKKCYKVFKEGKYQDPPKLEYPD